MSITILSLFDGMSCGQLALNRLGITINKYFASEVDKHAIHVTQDNFPNTKQLGDVTLWKSWDIDWTNIDLIQAGSPCQGFSFAGKQLAFDDPRSKLFFTFVEILEHIQKERANVDKEPAIFMLENVRMKKEYIDVITETLGVEPICINSRLVSAQNRTRYYWTNIDGIVQPEDKGIILKDILEEQLDPKFIHTSKAIEYMNRQVKGGRTHWDFNHHCDSDDDKSVCITANISKGVPYNVIVDRREVGVVFDGDSPGFSQGEPIIRKLTPIECERLQTVPDNYTSSVSNTQRYRMLGNGWTVDVISHIYRSLKQ